ncbi:uncharacterized protein LOC128385414 [Panonychus citri]|uniref:uncharacterized protein LOC128385414 n=1 Tax=Panonychus citri TaxID=50023 RepID=UPI0023082E10|nr:uncharacterized protein LOC128385414 [Panonychus citri]
MVLSDLSNQDQRIRNLLGARKKYSDYTKDQCRNGAKEKAVLKSKIQDNQAEIIKIKEELEKYRREYNKIIKTMGKAHEDAVFRESEEDIVSDLIKQRNRRVKSRAELVLLEEVHRAKLMDLKKQLDKEKILKRRRDVFQMKSPSQKVRVKKEHQEKLDEWKQFEELVQQEIDKLREEKEQNRLKRIINETNRIKLQPLRPDKPAKVIPKVCLKPKTIKNAQVQTSICIEEKEVNLSLEDVEPEEIQKVSSSSQANVQFVPISVKPTKKVNSSLENLLAIRVAEKMNKMREKVTLTVKGPMTTTITKDAAINTSCLAEEEQSISDFSQTCYLPLPGELKRSASFTKGKVIDEKVENSNEKDEASSTVDLSLMSGINFDDLVQKIQQIKNLVNKAEPPKETKSIKIIKRPVIDPIEVVSSTGQNVRQENKSKSSIFDEYRISPVSSISSSPSISPTRSLSPCGLDSPQPSTPNSSSPPPSPPRVPGLSESSSSPCLSSASSTSSDATIKKLDSHLSLEDVSLSDDQSLEQGRFNDDSLSIVQPRSLQVSLDFSQFSKLLNVDKDKLWADVLDLAGVNKSTTFTKTPIRKYPKKYTQSTPKTRTTKDSVVFNCSTNQVTIPN